MFHRVLAIFGILLALFGVMVAPAVVTRWGRRRMLPIYSVHPDEGEVPRDLDDWTPVGFIDRTGPWEIREWLWMPRFRRVK